MAATVVINRWTGTSPGTPTDITSATTRASTSDLTNPGSTNKIPIPTAGTKYSFWVSTRLQVTGGTFGTVDNLRWYMDGANNFGTGVTMKVADASTSTDAGYRIAAGTVGDTGTLLNQTNHTGLDSAPVDAFGKTAASPLSYAGSTTSAAHVGDFIVWQIEVGTSAAPGTVSPETATFKYDET